MTVAYKIAQKDSRKKLKEGELNSFVANLSTDLLLGLTSLTILLNLLISESGSEVMIISLWGFLLLLYLVFHENTNRRLSQVQNWIAKYGLMPLLSFLLAGIYFFDHLMLPSHAFFFDNVRDRINNMFAAANAPTTASDAVNLGIYAMEALMIGYIAYGVVKAVQAGRDDEDWKQPLKLPLLVLFSTAAGDLAIGLLSA